MPWKHASRCGTRNDFFPSFEERHTWFSYIIHHSTYISRTIKEKYLVPSSRIYSRRNSISGRRRIQQLKNFQLVSHPLLLCSDVCKTMTMIQALDRSFFSFEIVAPIADILKTRIEFESIIFHCDIPSPSNEMNAIYFRCTWLNRIFLHCW